MQLQKSTCRFGSKARSQRGLTLLELIAGISVIVAMAGISLDFLDRFNQETAYQKTIERMETIKKALHEFARDTVVNRQGNAATTLAVTDPLHPRANKGVLYVANASPVLLSSFSAQLTPYFTSNETDMFRDGWGNPIYYRTLGAGVNDFSAAQAQAELISWGSSYDGVYDLNELNEVGLTNNDNVTYQLDFAAEFDAEAQRRVNEINAAIRRRAASTTALMPWVSSDATNRGYRYYMGIYEVLRAPSGFLPADFRYVYNPWRVDVNTTVGIQGTVLPTVLTSANADISYQAATESSNAWNSALWPVGEVQYIKP